MRFQLIVVANPQPLIITEASRAVKKSALEASVIIRGVLSTEK